VRPSLDARFRGHDTEQLKRIRAPASARSAQLTAIDHKFSIRLFARSYKRLIIGPSLGLHSEPTSKGASFKMRSFSVVSFLRKGLSGNKRIVLSVIASKAKQSRLSRSWDP